MGGGVEVDEDDEAVPVALPEGLPEGLPDGPLAVIAVSAGAEHDVVGAEVRVTIPSVDVVVGHVSQTTVDTAAAAKQVCN